MHASIEHCFNLARSVEVHMKSTAHRPALSISYKYRCNVEIVSLYMLKLWLTISILCIAYSGCVVPTYIGKSTLNETEVRKPDTKIKRVLFVGVGSTVSRLFLENLSPEVIQLLARSHVQCDFTYAGKISRRSHVNVNKLVTSEYDAYLVLNPMDTAYINTNKDVAIVATPLPGGYGASGSVMGNQYIEDFYVELYTNSNLLITKVWQAQLKVDFDIANPGRYQKIAKGIVMKLINNGFISKN
jgi:hypothetical protein